MLNDDQKISVVLPVYNCEKYLARAVESVLKQTYENWELIIVNDGSKDSSLEVAELYVSRDKRIKLIDKKNEGVSVARNKGMELADGDLLMFLDADDWYETDAFMTVIKNWEDSIQLLIFDYWDVPENMHKQYRKHFQKNKILFGDGYEKTMEDLLFTISGFYKEQTGTRTRIEAPWGRVYQLGNVKNKNIKFPRDIFMCEDQIFNMTVAGHINSAKYISKPIYDYYMNEDSVTGSVYSKEGYGEKLFHNIKQTDQCAKDIILLKETDEHWKAYYKYVFEGMKIVIWWMTGEKEKSQKREAREYCHAMAKEVSIYLCEQYSLSDRVILLLCQVRCFGIIDCVVGMRKKVKEIFHLR